MSADARGTGAGTGGPVSPQRYRLAFLVFAAAIASDVLDGWVARRFGQEQQDRILNASMDRAGLEKMSVSDYVDLYVSE